MRWCRPRNHIVPEEADTVRLIFTRYRELGSLGALIEELDRRRFGAGPLAHLLKNRFYIGEIAYRGEVYREEHEPILDRDLFEVVQAKLAANAVAQQVQLKGASTILQVS